MLFIISIGNKLYNRLQNLVYLTNSEHTRLHMTGNKYWLGRKHSEQSKEKMKKQVYCVELNKVFAGINIAAKELSLHHSSISNCCQGKLKTTGGYHFEYYEGEQK